jgi:F-type H+-transporting ATPase subunit b
VKLKWLIALGLSAGVLFASDGGSTETDFVPRVVNFLIFAVIIYYLLAEKAKVFFSSRQQEISAKLESVQDKVKASKKNKDDALSKVESAKKMADEIIATAKKEVAIISDNIAKSAENDLVILTKHQKEQKELEQRKMTKEVVSDVLKEMFEDGGFAINEKEFINVILKRIA